VDQRKPEVISDVLTNICDCRFGESAGATGLEPAAGKLWITNIKAFSTIAQRIDRSNARS